MEIKVDQLNQLTQAEASKPVEKGDGTFKFTLASQINEEQLAVRVNELLTGISEQGAILAKHQDIRDMRKYRKLVKDFLNEIVYRSHKFSRENFLDRRGRHRVYGIVRRVDSTLDELAQELMKDEQDHLTILAKIDEIRGMLLDIVT